MQLTDVPAILDEIRDRIMGAGLGVTKVHYGAPYTAQTAHPYVVVSLRPVRFEPFTVQEEAQLLEFEIVWRAEKPATGNLLLKRIEVFDALATALVVGASFGSLANYGTPPGQPAISAADLTEEEPDEERPSKEYSLSFVLNLTSYKTLV